VKREEGGAKLVIIHSIALKKALGSGKGSVIDCPLAKGFNFLLEAST
jgi:hypothetical protein